MAGTYQAGFAKVDIIPSLRGFHQKIRTELRGINPEIAVAVTPEMSGFQRKLRSQLGQAPTVEVKTDVDTTSALAKLRAFVADASRRARVTAHVDVDTRSADANLNGLRARTKWIAAAIAVGFGPASAALVALPALAGAALIPISALVVGMQGMGDAFKAFADAEDQAATNATANAKQQTAAARQIVSAQQQVVAAKTGLSHAYQDASFAAAAADRRVQDAERQLVSAQKASLQAQRDLTRARDDAVRAMRDLNFEVAGGALAERQAVLDVAAAQAELEQARASGVGGAALERVQIAYEQQVLSLQEIRARNTDLAREKAVSDRAGVDGSEQVTAAQQRAAQAAEGVADAERGVGDAQQAASQQRIQSQRALADAQLQVTQAQLQLSQAIQDSGTVGAAATDKITAAVAKLSPAAQEFVLAVRALKPEFRALKNTVQDALFAGLGPAFADFAHRVLPAMGTNLGVVATAMNGVTRSMLGFLATEQTMALFADLFAGIGPVITALGGPLQTFTTLFLKLAVAAMPGIVALVEAIGRIGITLSDALQPLIDSGAVTQAVTLLAELIGSLAPIIATVVTFGVQLMNTFGPSLIKVVGALAPVIDVLADVLLQAAPHIGQIAEMIAGALLPAMVALAPVVAALMPVFVDLIGLGLVIAVPLIQILAGAFLALWPAIEPLAPVIAAIAVAWRLLNLVMMANPIILIASLLALLVGGFIHLWNTSAGFRNFFIGIWKAIQTAISFAWNSIIKPVFDAIGTVVGWLWNNILKPVFDSWAALFKLVGDIIGWVWDSILKPVFDVIGTVVGWLWDNILKPTFEGWKTIFQAVGDVIQWVWDSIIKPVFDAIGTVVSWVWTNYVEPAMRGWGILFEDVGNGISWVWNNIIKPVFDGIKVAVGAVGTAFDSAVNWIRDLWNGLFDILKKPVNLVIDFVYNKGIRWLWNQIADLLGIDKLPEMALLAGGGVIDGYAPGRDTVPALLSPGEAVLVPELVRQIGPANILAANESASGRRSTTVGRFADGGVVGDASVARFAGGGVIGDVIDFIGGVAADIADAVTDPIGLVKRLLGDTRWIDAAARVPAKAIGAVGDFLWEKIKAIGEGFIFGDFEGGAADVVTGAMQKFALAQQGKRYQWGAVGPNTYDCSGLVGNLYAIATGKPLYRRYMTTATMGVGRHGMKPGRGQFTVYLGAGHTAANIGGLHAEAYGGNGVPLAIGRVGTPLSFYHTVMHLFAGGGLVGLKTDPAKRLASWQERGWPEPPLSALSMATAGPDSPEVGSAAKAFRAASRWYDAGGVARGAGFLPKSTLEPERVLSPAQTRSFDQLVAHIGAGRTLPVRTGGDTGGGEFTGQLYLDSGELMGVVRGEIRRENNATGLALTRRTR